MLSSLEHVFEFCSKDSGFNVDPSLLDGRGGLTCPEDFETATAKDDGGNSLGLCFRNLGAVGKDVPWSYCSAMCKSLGVNATLPVLQNEAEIKFAAQLARDGRASSVWIGLSDIETEGEWRWIDGKLTNRTEVTWQDENSPRDLPSWFHERSCGRDCGTVDSQTERFFPQACSQDSPGDVFCQCQVVSSGNAVQCAVKYCNCAPTYLYRVQSATQGGEKE